MNMNSTRTCLSALAITLTVCAGAAASARPLGPVDIGPGAEACAAERSHPVPGLVFVGGSKGGAAFARHAARKACAVGFAALALPYWRSEGLPPALERIELNRFDSAISAFGALDFVDAGAIGFVGYSRGSEAALLTAADNLQVRAVAGIVPGAVAGANIDFRDFFDNDAAWARDGAPLDYVTTRPDQPGANWREVMADQPPPSVERSAEVWAQIQAKPGFEDAVLPVESIRAPVLLIGAQADTVWASCAMADFLAARRGDRPTQVMCVDGAAHGFMAPPDEDETPSPAAEDAWADLFSFFAGALQPSGSMETRTQDSSPKSESRR